MIVAILLSIALLAVGTSLQFGALRVAASAIGPAPMPVRALPIAMTLVTSAHVAVALIYAVGFWFAVHGAGIGDLRDAGPEGRAAPDFMGYFYFSLVNMTTLGRGDLTPTGHLRFLAGVEAFQGFMLITASGSFVLQVMSGRNPFRS